LAFVWHSNKSIEKKKARIRMADLLIFKTWRPEEDSVTYRDPGKACKPCLSSPPAKRAGALLSGLEMKKAR
jgi:hypothetical protein